MSGLWLGYKITSVKTNKNISAAQQGSKHDNIMNERRRQPSSVQKKRQMHWQIQVICL